MYDMHNGSPKPEDICRDYMRNVCTRGKKCRYKHPAHMSLTYGVNTSMNTQEERLKFSRAMCHDFQNSVCNRDGCKYIHCSKDDLDTFMENGSLSTYVIEDAIAKSVIPCLPGEPPVCRDYLSGECRRGKSCKFRHMSLCKYRKELDLLFGVEVESSQETACAQQQTSFCEGKRLKTSCQPCGSHTGEISCVQSPCKQAYATHDSCKLHYHERCSITHGRGTCQVTYNESYCDRNNEPTSHLFLREDRTVSLQDEMAHLKKQVIDLKRQVSDLTAANEYLLEQNATLRLSRKNGNVVALQPPAPTTLVAGPTMNVQAGPGQLVTMSGQNASVVAAAVPVSLASVSCQGATQMTLSTGNAQQLVPVSCHALAAVSSVTVAGQTGASPALLAAAVPVSQQQLVPVSSTASQLVPVSAVPVSLSAVSMAPVHMPPIVTAASDPTNSIAMSVSPATSLVSYRIMTHVARRN